ncbi:redoxin domain-containing protein [bacterium]|nr:redoxin domain-containing protein [bacterium]
MVPDILIQLAIAAVATLLIGRLLIKKKEERTAAESTLTNGALAYLISLKLSLLITHFHSVRAEPLMLFYGWGSQANVAAGLLGVALYFAWFILKKSENKSKHARYLTLSSLVFIGVFLLGKWFNTPKSATALPVAEILAQQSDVYGSELSIDTEKPIILNFWATWCPPCRSEMPELSAYYASSQNHNFLLINNIASEKQGLAGVQQFLHEKGYNLNVVADYQNELTNLLQINSFPTTVVVSADGMVLEKHVGVVDQSFLEQWENP